MISIDQDLYDLFSDVVPERSGEISVLIDKHAVHFREVPDEIGFCLRGGAYGAVQFTQRSLNQLWLFGFSGLYALHCYSGIAFLALCHKVNFDLDEISGLPDQKEEDYRFATIVKAIEDLNKSASQHDFNWPPSIPKTSASPPKDVEQAAVFDIVRIATAYIFLHELKHVIFRSEDNAPTDRKEEEVKCDSFASGMILDQIDLYAVSSGYSEEKIRMKRCIGIALANAFFAVTTAKSRAQETEHPPVHKRWSANLANINLHDNDFYWLYFASLSIALLKYKRIKYPSQIVTSFRRLALSSISALEEEHSRFDAI